MSKLQPYYDLCREVLDTGSTVHHSRTGERTRSLFAKQIRIQMGDGLLPVVTRKRVNLHNILTELNWFLSGNTNIKALQDSGVNIWNEWADEDGNLGPVYGKQWRDWDGVDQISRLIAGIHTDPTSRRHIVNAWNVGELSEMALPPCHMMFQVYVSGSKMSMQVYQRSADLFLGVPYNITSYAILLAALAGHTGYIPNELVFTYGDVHVYENHVKQTEWMLSLPDYPMPEFTAKLYTDLGERANYQIRMKHETYQSGPYIAAPVAV